MSLSVAAFVACSSPETFRGTELTARAPATSFTLTNQFSRSVSLDDYRGKVVLLTFLYTSCPDICPLTTSNIREAHELLGSDAEELAMVAVSVDPERDTVEEALDFSQHWQMTDRWDFLTGRRAELERIWRAYYIDPSVDGGSDAHETSTGSTQTNRTGAVGALRQAILGQTAEPSNGYLVSHSSPVYLLDRAGLIRVLHTLPFEPNALAHDIRLLID
jgi:protein SCO1/2